ncbi:hypothetical protein CROQUDRAFT_66388 [Cronartium quercuum f. sp. fusiforme G11]|uniref:Major facilitator superfamily (MFS) profile domain-containing protein n=1 Tax=Cronartium quercuum f. sp. fusiforme G11 TaxID=708437 RepID=A0A9P6NAZ8_9BASI|nr:hypothetical protein CROQUDRAFT_66388 [Cronartium quercuum f. sp. fusiforme G11]
MAIFRPNSAGGGDRKGPNEAHYTKDDSNSESTDPSDVLAEREAVWRLDLAVIPIVSLFYFLSFLDRANLGNARVAGLQKGLGLSEFQYSMALTTTYIPYIAAEIPANLFLKKIGPHIILPTIVAIWGIITACQGLVTSYAGLVAARFFLGLVEGGMFPGIVLYLSYFYTRRELQLRIALFFSSASLSGAFSGLLAYGLIRLDGVGGRPGWAWIFIVEGLFTFVCGVLGYFIIPSTPASARFLNSEQKRIIFRRLAQDQPTTMDNEEVFSWSEVLASFKSLHVQLNFVALFMSGTSLYSLAYFQPTIVNSLGYSTSRTQLMSVPPFASAFVVMLATAYLSDRYRARGITACGCAVIALIGFIMFFCSKPNQHKLKYGSLFLSVAGVYSIPPPLSAWQANNSFCHYRKAVSIALGFVATNLGGVLSTWMFPKRDGPEYRMATIINMTFSVGTVVFAILNLCWLRYANVRKKTRRDKLLQNYQLNLADPQISHTENIRAWHELGDQHPDFKYAY